MIFLTQRRKDAEAQANNFSPHTLRLGASAPLR